MLDPDLDPFGRKQFRKAFAPLDQGKSAGVKQVLEPKMASFVRRVQPVKIHVVNDGWIAVFVDERESRAGNFVGIRRAAGFHNAFGKRGFPGPELSNQKDNRVFRQQCSKLAAYLASLFV